MSKHKDTFRFHGLIALFAVACAVFVGTYNPRKAEAGYGSTSLAAAGAACWAIYVPGKIANGDLKGYDACVALATAVFRCSGQTLWNACFNLCTKPAQGASYVGYYSGTVPCTTIC